MKKILIIEDDSFFADQLKAKLADTYQTEICPDGQSGYYAIYEFKPDVVLLDLTIDQMDAVSLVGKMRVQKQFQKLPIFILADSKAMSLADDALAAGANAAFLKDEVGTVDSVVAALFDLMSPTLSRRPASKTDNQVSSIPRPLPDNDRAASPPQNGNGHALPSRAEATSIASPLPPPAPPTNFIPPPRLDPARHVTPVVDSRGAHARTDVPVTTPGHRFLDDYGSKAHILRQDFIRYRTGAETERKQHFDNFVRNVKSLNVDALTTGFIGLTRYLTAIESRVHQLAEKNEAISSSSLQILAGALDVLAALSNHLTELEPLNNLLPHALVVDDEAISRKSLCQGLEKAMIKTTQVDSPDAGIHEAEGKPFDIVFLDVDLPKMNGFALCARIRIIPAHRKTPILFVTSLTDVKSRASSRVSGGNQFLTKPLNMPELGINAWTLVIRKRILEDAQHRARP